MGQFTLHENPNPNTRKTFPYLLDVQASLLGELNTRVVIPVARLAPGDSPISHLCPVIEHEGECLVLYTQQLAAIPQSKMGVPLASLDDYRTEIIAALDFLLTGI